MLHLNMIYTAAYGLRLMLIQCMIKSKAPSSYLMESFGTKKLFHS